MGRRKEQLNARLNASLWWVVAPAMAVFMIVMTAQDLVPSYRSLAGSGVPGTFTARERECGRGGCTSVGTFVSDDGNRVRARVRLGPPGSPHPGERVRALDSGGRKVYPREGSTDAGLITLFLVLAIGVLIAWAWTLIRKLRAARP